MNHQTMLAMYLAVSDTRTLMRAGYAVHQAALHCCREHGLTEESCGAIVSLAITAERGCQDARVAIRKERKK